MMPVENYNNRTLMNYSPDIKVLDCTMRDGGLVNNFAFSDEFVRDLYEANAKAGVDYMEFGYKASKDLFDPKEFGKWKFCDEKDILLIFDEIQCGMGRSGSMFACQKAGVRPDVMAVAKALGNGLPIGAFLTTEKAAVLVPGDHGTTYGGNPLVCAGASAVLDIFEKEHILDNVNRVGAYLWEKLEALKNQYPVVKDHRGVGLIQGLEFMRAPGEIAAAVIKKGVILITAEHNVLRFVPPLVIREEHVDEMIQALEEVLGEQG